jgi:type III secretion protein U
MSGDGSEAKTKPASQQKLRKQRDQGKVPQTKKMVSLATTAMGLVAMLLLAPSMFATLVAFFDSTFRQMGTPLARFRASMLDQLAETLLYTLVPIFGTVVVTAIALIVTFHKGIPFSIKPIIPNFGKLNPGAGLKQMLGKRTWVEVGIGLVQIILWGGFAVMIVIALLQPILSVHACGLPCAGAVIELLCRRLVYAAIGFYAVMIGLDILVQRNLYAKEQRMTKTEVKREQKDNYGSPEIRAARNRAKQQARLEADASQYAGANKANMCFYTADCAIGIRYHPHSTPVPRVTFVAETREATLALRQQLRDAGRRELEETTIVKACIKIRPGMPVPTSVYEAFGRGINKMYGS